MVRTVQDCTTEIDRPVGFKIICGDCWELDAHFDTIANDDGVEDFMVVHNVKFRNAGDDLAIEREDYVSFEESACFVATLECAFTNHEELVAGGVIESDFLDPFF
jgi:hypothetical protein